MDSSAMYAPLQSDEQQVPPLAQRKATKTPIVPVPSDAAPMQFKHPKYGEPARSWPYHDAEARLVGYVCRWNFNDDDGRLGKEILPITYCDIGNGKRAWRSAGIPAPRPLFDLVGILLRPDKPVLICEGEKTCDAAAILFPDMVVTTPAHGAKSPHLTDFGPCAGRVVIIATDYDEPGRKDKKGKPLHPGQDFGDAVCALVRQAGAESILHLHPTRLGMWVWRDGEKTLRTDPIPDGWDLADALADGWTAERVAEMKDDPAFLSPYLDADKRRAARSETDDGDGPPDDSQDLWPFRLAPNGVEKRVERADKETGTRTVEWRWFCSRIEVVAETRSSEGEEWGRLLEITDRDGRVKTWAMPMSMLAGDGTAYRERLLSLGLTMAAGKFARDALHEFITTARPETKVRCVNRIGWHGKAYVGLTRNFGE
jgi:hypothetical protein